jgi:hypothetical protein
MAKVIAERMSVRRQGGLVVFVIGMRVNSWWKVHKWLPVMLAMPRMLRELYKNPDSGFLGAQFSLGSVIQYWSSTEKLFAYAKDRSAEHYPAWASFNRKVGTDGSVGIWHETYVVPAGQFECIYVNMPRVGLGQFSELVPARGKLSRASGRLSASAAPTTADDVEEQAVGLAP